LQVQSPATNAFNFSTLVCENINKATPVRVIVICSVHRHIYGGTLIKVLVAHQYWLSLYCTKVFHRQRYSENFKMRFFKVQFPSIHLPKKVLVNDSEITAFNLIREKNHTVGKPSFPFWTALFLIIKFYVLDLLYCDWQDHWSRSENPPCLACHCFHPIFSCNHCVNFSFVSLYLAELNFLLLKKKH